MKLYLLICTSLFVYLLLVIIYVFLDCSFTPEHWPVIPSFFFRPFKSFHQKPHKHLITLTTALHSCFRVSLHLPSWPCSLPRDGRDMLHHEALLDHRLGALAASLPSQITFQDESAQSKHEWRNFSKLFLMKACCEKYMSSCTVMWGWSNTSNTCSGQR